MTIYGVEKHSESGYSCIVAYYMKKEHVEVEVKRRGRNIGDYSHYGYYHELVEIKVFE